MRTPAEETRRPDGPQSGAAAGIPGRRAPAAVSFDNSAGRNSPSRMDYLFLLLLIVALWGVHGIWLSRDTRPPVWDMAMHQGYALNYLPGAATPGIQHYWDLSGNYPPFVHLMIALAYLIFRPGYHVAILANLPATALLLWGVHRLGVLFCDARAARWAAAITVLIPYLIWMSRETILDYWLSAWVVTSLALLWGSNGFASRSSSMVFGIACGLGLLTKWIFAGFLFFPTVYVFARFRVWRSQSRLIHMLDALLVAASLAGIWYIPNLPKLIRYFSENAKIGAREGEPAVFSFQSWIYYLRLLEGYQLFALLFLLVAASCYFAWKKNLLKEGGFWLVCVLGGWAAMTLLRTKDPRFTMPLLGLLAIPAGAWIAGWSRGWKSRAARVLLVAVLGVQAYAVNFGIGILPEEVVLAKGYQGSLRWDWNLYLQHYFHILGAPRREDWKQAEMLRRVAEDSSRRNLHPSIGVVPDLPRLNAANIFLVGRLLQLPVRVDHVQAVPRGLRSFEEYDYVIMTEREQGMPWSTANSRALNQIIVDEHEIFRLLGVYALPNGDAARLYHIRRGGKEGG